MFEEKASGKLAAGDRPALLAALSHVRDGDLLAVQEVDRLGRNLLEGLIVLSSLFERGIGVKVLEGIAAGEHTERSLILDLTLALAEDRRRDIVRKTRDGIEAARRQGRAGGRRPSSTTTSAPPSSPAAAAGNPSASSPPASRSPSASCTRPWPRTGKDGAPPGSRLRSRYRRDRELQIARAVLAQPATAALIQGEEFTGPSVVTGEDTIAYSLATAPAFITPSAPPRWARTTPTWSTTTSGCAA